MADLADGMESDIKNMKERMEENSRAADLYFDGFMRHADHLKGKFQGTFEAISKDFTVS